MFSRIPVRKTIALSIMFSYILCNVYILMFGGTILESFTSTTVMIVGYYFGKSTALDTSS